MNVRFCQEEQSKAQRAAGLNFKACIGEGVCSKGGGGEVSFLHPDASSSASWQQHKHPEQ